MTRSLLNLTLAVAVLTLSQATAEAGRRNYGNKIESQVASFVRATQSGGNRNSGSNNRGRQNQSGKLRETSKLDNELRQTRQEIQALAAKVSGIEKSVESSRKSAQDIASMFKSIGRLDDKVGRIKRQLESVSKIPQLRLLRPLVNNLSKVRQQIHKVRVKADQVNRETVQPLISKLKKAERKLEAKVSEIRQVASQTQQARQKLEELRSFVESRGYKNVEVRALESTCKPVRSTIRPVNQMVSQMSRSLGNIDREFSSLARQLRSVSKAKGSVQKLERDLASADKAARNLDKVLSKKISIKFPKKISISVRQVLEAPGKLLDIVVKPLEKLANKALKPVLSKLKIQVKVPGEINGLTGQFDRMKSAVSGLGSSLAKVEKALEQQVPKNYRNQISNLMRKSTSQLTR